MKLHCLFLFFFLSCTTTLPCNQVNQALSWEQQHSFQHYSKTKLFFFFAIKWNLTEFGEYKKYSSFRKAISSIWAFFWKGVVKKKIVAATQITYKVNHRLIGVSKWDQWSFSTNAQEWIWFPESPDYQIEEVTGSSKDSGKEMLQ